VKACSSLVATAKDYGNLKFQNAEFDPIKVHGVTIPPHLKVSKPQGLLFLARLIITTAWGTDRAVTSLFICNEW